MEESTRLAPFITSPRRSQFVGQYELGKTIGSGQFGKVKLAVHQGTGVKVAIKIINKTKMDEDTLLMVYREIAIMKLMRHPNIIRLYEVVDTEQVIFLIMEYASGGEVLDFVVAHGRLHEREARRFFRQILSALHYCHSLHVVHRDLKCENLLLDKYLNVKIIDFGLSNHFTPGMMMRTFCGSPTSAAPELIQKKEYHGPEILYVLVVGKLPFEGTDFYSLFTKILAAQYSMPDFLSEDCQALLRSILVVNPAERATLADVIKHKWVRGSQIDSPPMILATADKKITEAELDPEILSQMEKSLNYSRHALVKSIVSNKYDDMCATYHLLVEKKKRPPPPSTTTAPSLLAPPSSNQEIPSAPLSPTAKPYAAATAPNSAGTTPSGSGIFSGFASPMISSPTSPSDSTAMLLTTPASRLPMSVMSTPADRSPPHPANSSASTAASTPAGGEKMIVRPHSRAGPAGGGAGGGGGGAAAAMIQSPSERSPARSGGPFHSHPPKGHRRSHSEQVKASTLIHSSPSHPFTTTHHHPSPQPPPPPQGASPSTTPQPPIVEKVSTASAPVVLATTSDTAVSPRGATGPATTPLPPKPISLGGSRSYAFSQVLQTKLTKWREAFGTSNPNSTPSSPAMSREVSPRGSTGAHSPPEIPSSSSSNANPISATSSSSSVVKLSGSNPTGSAEKLEKTPSGSVPIKLPAGPKMYTPSPLVPLSPSRPTLVDLPAGTPPPLKLTADEMSPPSALWGSALVPHISVRSPRGSAVVHPAPPPAPPSLLSQPGASSFGAPNISAGSTSPSASTIHGHTPLSQPASAAAPRLLNSSRKEASAHAPPHGHRRHASVDTGISSTVASSNHHPPHAPSPLHNSQTAAPLSPTSKKRTSSPGDSQHTSSSTTAAAAVASSSSSSSSSPLTDSVKETSTTTPLTSSAGSNPTAPGSTTKYFAFLKPQTLVDSFKHALGLTGSGGGGGTSSAPNANGTAASPSPLTPQSHSHNEPRAARFAFNAHATSSQPPAKLLELLKEVLTSMQIYFLDNGPFSLDCYHQSGDIRFEVEVCKLPRLANMHGLRLKRISGDVWAYKSLVSTLMTKLDLEKLMNRDSARLSLHQTPASAPSASIPKEPEAKSLMSLPEESGK